MITPEYLNEIMYGVEDKLTEVNEYLIERIVKRIIKAFENEEGNLFIPSTINDLRKLINNGILYEDVQQAIKKALPDIEGAIKDAFYKSAAEITNQNMAIAESIVKLENLSSVNIPKWEQVGITQKASELNMTKAEIRQLEEAFRRTKGEMRNLTRTVALKAEENYINACDNAYMKVKSGVSVQTAVVEAIKEVSDRGIEVVNFRGGKTEKIEVAIARAVRTGVNQANSSIVLTRCNEMGVNYVKVSAHLGARVTEKEDYTNHSWWQGRVYKVDWSNLKDYKTDPEEGFEWIDQMKKDLEKKNKHDYPDFVEKCGYGQMLGIAGINCRHSFYPFYPGIQLDDDDRPDLEENEKRYKLEQKARAMERAIRKTKRELAGLKAAGKREEEEIINRKREVKKQLYDQSEAYMKFCKDNNVKPRNMALKI